MLNSRSKKPCHYDRASERRGVRGLNFLGTTGTTSCDGASNTILYCNKYRRGNCMNIVKHMVRLLKSDAFLAAVLGVWLCSMMAWGAML